jgi:hypothetical protein
MNYDFTSGSGLILLPGTGTPVDGGVSPPHWGCGGAPIKFTFKCSTCAICKKKSTFEDPATTVGVQQ